MRQYMIILTTLFAFIGWSIPATASDNHREHNFKQPHSNKYYKQSRKAYKKARKHARQSRPHSYRYSYSNRSQPHSYSDSYYNRSRPHNNYGFRVDGHYGYYNNQRFNRNQHHGQQYYSNRGGYYFPNYGYIARGHRHNRHCPSWHSRTLVAGVLLGLFLGS